MKQVVGQQAAKSGLINMWQSNHLPHALLILGNEGTGGLPLALAFSQYVFCSNKQDQEACGNCSNCHKVAKMEHADLHLSFPTIPPKSGTKAKSQYFIQEFREFFAQTPYGTTYDWLQYINAENKQGNLTADECRDIIEKLNLKSYEGGKKIQIIWRPEYLGKEGNILLKLIEEPPADTLLLLVAENTEEVLATILSRTQIIRLAPIKATDIAQGLTDRLMADAKKAAQIAHIANGSFTEALSLVRHADNDLFPDVRRWFNAIFTNKGLEIIKFVDDISKSGREQQKNLFEFIIRLLEQTVRYRYLPHIEPALPEEECAFVKKLSGMKMPTEALHEMMQTISKTIYHIERNAHSKTQLMAVSIRICHIIANKTAIDL